MVAGNPTAPQQFSVATLTPEELARFRVLRLEYEGLKQLAANAPPEVVVMAETIESHADQDESSLSRETLYLFTRCLLRLSRLDDLKGKAMCWRTQLLLTAGFWCRLLRQGRFWGPNADIITERAIDQATAPQELWDHLDLLLCELARLDPCNPTIAAKRLRLLQMPQHGHAVGP